MHMSAFACMHVCAIWVTCTGAGWRKGQTPGTGVTDSHSNLVGAGNKTISFRRAAHALTC